MPSSCFRESVFPSGEKAGESAGKERLFSLLLAFREQEAPTYYVAYSYFEGGPSPLSSKSFIAREYGPKEKDRNCKTNR